MKQKKQSSLARILSYAGGHKKLTLLGCILSALSAILGLIPYICVWLAVRDVLEIWPGFSGTSALTHWGWTAVWTAIGSIFLYFAALMSTPYRSLPHCPQYTPHRYGSRPQTAFGILFGKSIRPSAKTHRRQRGAHRRPAGSQASRSCRNRGHTDRRRCDAVPL